MTKKVVQVPMDDALLDALDAFSKERRRSRADVIRLACERFLRGEEDALLDALYRDGYRRVPEEQAVGEVQSTVLAQVLPEESW